jgi:ribosomal protein S18 acetylase RimI-like enzyme
LKVIRLQQQEEAIARYIIDHLVEKEEGGPTAEDVQSLLTDERTYLFAAMSAGEEVIGYALAYCFPALYRPGGLAYLYDIEVAEAHRRKGAGRLLIEAALRHLKTDGVTELWLGTDTDNEAAQALYRATGAQRSEGAFYDFTYRLI